MGQFYYAAKAFDTLERLDAGPEYTEGKRGACVGIFQLVIAGLEGRESLADVVHMLRNSAGDHQSDAILRTVRRWAKENGIVVPN